MKGDEGKREFGRGRRDGRQVEWGGVIEKRCGLKGVNGRGSLAQPSIVAVEAKELRQLIEFLR